MSFSLEEHTMFCGNKVFGGNKVRTFGLALTVILFGAASAHAQVLATGSVTAAPSGANYLYTISLHNSGTVPIETFWFSWLPDHYDFLPSVPTSIVAPAGWTDYVET